MLELRMFKINFTEKEKKSRGLCFPSQTLLKLPVVLHELVLILSLEEKKKTTWDVMYAHCRTLRKFSKDKGRPTM